jgi:chromosome segregation ATPase
MLDTLKLTKRLEGAGLERQVAEAMAEAFAESTSETVATKDDLRHEVATLRAEIHSLGSELRTEMHSLGSELRTEMQTFRWQIIAAVALLLLVHLSAVWGIVAAHVP